MTLSKIEELVFELLNFDVHEVSIVDNPANDQEWLAIKGMHMNDVGDYVAQHVAQEFGAFDPTRREALLDRLAGVIKAMAVIEKAVKQTTPQAGSVLPPAIKNALAAVTDHLIGDERQAKMAELSELDALSGALTELDLDAPASSDQAVKAVMGRAVTRLAEKDRMIAKLRRDLRQANSRILPSQATTPEQLSKSEVDEQGPPKPVFPYMYKQGRRSNPGS